MLHATSKRNRVVEAYLSKMASRSPEAAFVADYIRDLLKDSDFLRKWPEFSTSIEYLAHSNTPILLTGGLVQLNSVLPDVYIAAGIDPEEVIGGSYRVLECDIVLPTSRIKLAMTTGGTLGETVRKSLAVSIAHEAFHALDLSRPYTRLVERLQSPALGMANEMIKVTKHVGRLGIHAMDEDTLNKLLKHHETQRDAIPLTDGESFPETHFGLEANGTFHMRSATGLPVRIRLEADGRHGGISYQPDDARLTPAMQALLGRIFYIGSTLAKYEDRLEVSWSECRNILLKWSNNPVAMHQLLLYLQDSIADTKFHGLSPAQLVQVFTKHFTLHAFKSLPPVPADCVTAVAESETHIRQGGMVAIMGLEAIQLLSMLPTAPPMMASVRRHAIPHLANGISEAVAEACIRYFVPDTAQPQHRSASAQIAICALQILIFVCFNSTLLENSTEQTLNIMAAEILATLLKIFFPKNRNVIDGCKTSLVTILTMDSLERSPSTVVLATAGAFVFSEHGKQIGKAIRTLPKVITPPAPAAA